MPTLRMRLFGLDLLLGYCSRPGAQRERRSKSVDKFLEGTTLPIQGPSGSGKTYAGARMLCALVKAGLRVGVTAVSHKVIRNLLTAVLVEAAKNALVVRAGHKVGDTKDTSPLAVEFEDNTEALSALTARSRRARRHGVASRPFITCSMAH